MSEEQITLKVIEILKGYVKECPCWRKRLRRPTFSKT